jgi:hypothetical protein
MPTDDERKQPAKPASDSGEREPKDRDSRLPLAEILRRGISAGQAVSESLFPRELAGSLAAQLVDARHGLVNAIAVEVGRFLRQADIASEVRKVLAGLNVNVEAKITLKFSEDSQGNIQTDVHFGQRGGTGASSGASGGAAPSAAGRKAAGTAEE